MNINRGNPVVRDPNIRPGTEPSARMLETLWRSVTGMTGRNGVTVEHRPMGGAVIGYTAPTAYRKPFDIYDLTATTLKMRAFIYNDASANAQVNVAGRFIAVGGTFDAAITITAASYIYIKDTITNNGQTHTCTLTIAGAVEDGGDDVSPVAWCWPLWYIGWSDSKIDTANIWDLRGAFQLPGYGN